jgi:hypothetical protein
MDKEGGKTLRKHLEGGKTLRKFLEPLSQDPVRLGGLLLQSRITAARISSLHSYCDLEWSNNEK